jgi:hypothetical protein
MNNIAALEGLKNEPDCFGNFGNWQIFDTGNGCMIDLENPVNNGYSNFNNYLNQIRP